MVPTEIVEQMNKDELDFKRVIQLLKRREYYQATLEDIVDQYFNDIVEIIMRDNRYRDKLLKKLSIQEKSSKH